MRRPRTPASRIAATALLAAAALAAACSSEDRAPDAAKTSVAAPTAPPSCVRCDRLSAFNYRLLMFDLRLTVEQASPDVPARLADLAYFADRADVEDRPQFAAALRAQTAALAAAIGAGDDTAVQRALAELERLQTQLPE